MVPCIGDRVGWRRVSDPPPLEIHTADGVLVLDDADATDLRYVLISSTD